MCWLIDSSASCHFTYNPEMLLNITELRNDCFVKTSNDECLKVQYNGTCYLRENLVLSNVLLVPEFKVNLIYVSKIILDNLLVHADVWGPFAEETMTGCISLVDDLMIMLEELGLI